VLLRFYAELQAQQADLKSGGQGGMNPHLKGKKGPRKNKANI
jgi:nucleolar protein 14